MRHFIEANKDRFIDRNPNLTDRQKEIIKNFLAENPDGLRIKDWNTHISADTFYQKINEFNNRNTPKGKLSDLQEGVDYDILAKDEYYTYYVPYKYKAGVILASNNVEPEYYGPLPDWYEDASGFKGNVSQDYPTDVYDFDASNETVYGGAKWCITMNHTDYYWKDYMRDEGYVYVIAIVNLDSEYLEDVDTNLYKIAITVRDDRVDDMFDIDDNKVDTDTKEMIETTLQNYLKIDYSKIEGWDDSFAGYYNDDEEEEEDYEDELVENMIEYDALHQNTLIDNHIVDNFDIFTDFENEVSPFSNPAYSLTYFLEENDLSRDDLHDQYNYNNILRLAKEYIDKFYENFEKWYLPSIYTPQELIDYTFTLGNVIKGDRSKKEVEIIGDIMVVFKDILVDYKDFSEIIDTVHEHPSRIDMMSDSDYHHFLEELFYYLRETADFPDFKICFMTPRYSVNWFKFTSHGWFFQDLTGRWM